METLYADEFYFLGLIVLAPLIGAIINGVFGSKLPRKAVDWVACGAMALSFVFSILSVVGLMQHTGQVEAEGGMAPHLTYSVYEWIFSGDLNAELAFLFDPLTAVLALVVTGVGLLIHIYSIGYMADDPDKWRYFSYLNLFASAMLILVLGQNMLVTFIGWEGVGVCSYLLIGFWFSDEQKAQAGQKAFLVNRVGDFFFLLGLFLVFYMTGTWDYIELAQIATEPALAAAQLAPIAFPAGLLIFLGCTGKSAQIPLYVWLPDAMAGPTPVSALIHAATMVTAGIFLLCRLNWLITYSPELMAIIALTGALTAIFAASMAIVQNDIKRVLAYSTVSQLGFMFMAVGVGAFSAAVFHLMTHAFFKALLFLGAGAVITAMHHEQDIRKMGGLKDLLPWTHATFAAATLAIAGVPLFAGFYSKDLILWNAIAKTHVFNVEEVMEEINFLPQAAEYLNTELVPQLVEADGAAVDIVGWAATVNWAVWIIGLLTAALTAFYMFRLYFLTFWGECRADEETKEHIHEVSLPMRLPLAVLGVLSVVGGYIGWPHFIALLPDGIYEAINPYAFAFENWLEEVFFVANEYRLVGRFGDEPYWLELGAAGLAVIIAAAGIGLAYFLYVKRPDLPGVIKERTEWAYNVLINLYWVDEAYDFLFVRSTLALGKAMHWFDKYIIAGLLVGGVSFMTQNLGRALSNLQSGNVQRYSTYITLALVLITLAILWSVGWGPFPFFE